MSCIKKGDRVRRIKTGCGAVKGKIGYEFIVADVDAAFVTEHDGTSHSLKNIEKVPDDLKTQIADLQKQLDALKKQEENQAFDNAKVLVHKNSGNKWDVLAIDGDNFWLKERGSVHPSTFRRVDLARFGIVESNCGC